MAHSRAFPSSLLPRRLAPRHGKQEQKGSRVERGKAQRSEKRQDTVQTLPQARVKEGKNDGRTLLDGDCSPSVTKRPISLGFFSRRARPVSPVLPLSLTFPPVYSVRLSLLHTRPPPPVRSLSVPSFSPLSLFSPFPPHHRHAPPSFPDWSLKKRVIIVSPTVCSFLAFLHFILAHPHTFPIQPVFSSHITPPPPISQTLLTSLVCSSWGALASSCPLHYPALSLHVCLSFPPFIHFPILTLTCWTNFFPFLFPCPPHFSSSSSSSSIHLVLLSLPPICTSPSAFQTSGFYYIITAPLSTSRPLLPPFASYIAHCPLYLFLLHEHTFTLQTLELQCTRSRLVSTLLSTVRRVTSGHFSAHSVRHQHTDQICSCANEKIRDTTRLPTLASKQAQATENGPAQAKYKAPGFPQQKETKKTQHETQDTTSRHILPRPSFNCFPRFVSVSSHHKQTTQHNHKCRLLAGDSTPQAIFPRCPDREKSTSIYCWDVSRQSSLVKIL